MKTKFNLDRKPLDSSFIQSRQDFDKVIKGYQAMKPPLWKNPWFYGPVGLASLALVLTITFQNNFFAGENNSTLVAKAQNKDNQTLEDTPCIKSVSENSDIPFEKFTIDPKNGGKVITVNGSIIDIPKGSLLADKNGQVTIQVREFADPSEAFTAGIPMDFEKTSAFESGGMIEIRGEQNGQAISIDPKKPIKVDMTLQKSGDGFKFWAMNDKNGEWTEYPCNIKEVSSAKVTTKFPDNSKIISQVVEIKAEIENCEKEIVELKKAEEKEALIPSQSARKLVVEFDQGSFPELAGYKEVEFEYLLPKDQTQANMSAFKKRIEYASSQTWYDMDVSKGKTDYVVTFKNSKENFSIPVKPVLKGKSLAKLDQELKKAKADKQTQIVKLEEERIALLKRDQALKLKYETEVNDIKNQLNSYVPASQNQELAQRSVASTSAQSVNAAGANLSNTRGNFLTNNFGVFNCDKPVSYPKPFNQPILCKNEDGVRINVAGAYVFDQKQNTRFTFGEINFHKIQDLAWIKRNKSTLIVIDQKGDLYYKQEINDDPLNDSAVILKRIGRENVNLETIQKILSENSITA